MISYITIQALTDGEIDKIHGAMVSILSRTGLLVEHPDIREAYAQYGARVDHDAQRVWIPEKAIDRFLSETEPVDYSSTKPVVSARSDVSLSWQECFQPLCPGGRPSMSTRSGISFGSYLEPDTSRIVPFTEETLAGYIKLARLLDSGIIVRLETLPVGEARPTQPLEARLFAWKHGAIESGGIQMTELRPYLLEMYEIRADSLGLPLANVFCGSVYIISPLRIPRDVGEQIMFFHRHGLRVRIGNMFTVGGSGPVTLAGCLALNLAERIAIGILDRVLYGLKRWVIFGEVVPLDMATMQMASGRPELLLFNLAVIQLARHYKVAAHPFGGYCTATFPSVEAGMQKVMTALPCILAGGCNIDAGRLGMDAVHSPLQMILDSELICALRRVLRGFEVNEDTLAVDLINEIGPGGSFLAAEHTVRHMRSELWQPRVWSREGWRSQQRSGGQKTDVERALDIWHDLMAKPDFDPFMSEDTERRLQAVVDRAARNLYATPIVR